LVYDDGLILPDESNSGISERQLTSDQSLSAIENKRLKFPVASGKGGEINIFLTLETPKNDTCATT
jgi:hypothetical protein